MFSLLGHLDFEYMPIFEGKRKTEVRNTWDDKR